MSLQNDYIVKTSVVQHSEVSDQAIARISPARPGAINPYGTHNIDVAGILDRGHRRPLRAPKRR